MNVDSVRLIGTRDHRFTTRWSLTRHRETIYSGIFHFWFCDRGLVRKHVFEVIDERLDGAKLSDWVPIGQKVAAQVNSR